VLEAAGVNLEWSVEKVAEAVNTLGVGFLFAAKHHAAARHTVPARQSLGVRTLFNLIGPLANPAGAPHQLLGVFDPVWVKPMAEVLKQLGSRHVLVVSAEDGLDEISLQSPTQVAELKDGEITCYQITPEAFGFERASLKELEIQDAAESLRVIKSVFSNQAGPARDIVALNAGAAIYAADLVETLALGVERALAVIASGEAQAKFDALISLSQSNP
jgi:anthranilate phosphoribosyltransferase